MNIQDQHQLIYFILGLIFLFVFAILVIYLFYLLIKSILIKVNKMKCKNGLHKWVPVFIKATYNNKEIKFISCFCDRCRIGYDETLQINEIGQNRIYGTYSEKYFKK